VNDDDDRLLVKRPQNATLQYSMVQKGVFIRVPVTAITTGYFTRPISVMQRRLEPSKIERSCQPSKVSL